MAIWRTTGLVGAIRRSRLILTFSMCVVLVLAATCSVSAADKPSKGGAKSAAVAKTADKPDADDDLTDPSDLELDDDLTALIVPSTQLGTVKAVDRTKFSLELRRCWPRGWESKARARRPRGDISKPPTG